MKLAMMPIRTGVLGALAAAALGCAATTSPTASDAQSAAEGDALLAGDSVANAQGDVPFPRADAAGTEDTAEDTADQAPDTNGGEVDVAAADDVADAGDGGEVTALPDDLDMKAEDFPCITTGTKVRSFYLWNLSGRLDEALAVANSTEGGKYPVGTLLQLVPSEAMVKRKAGFSPATADWEFFALDTSASGTVIVARGAEDTVNQFGGNCAGCHAKAEPKWDLICEKSHGCDALPLTPEFIDALQTSDPRCGAQ